MTDSAKTVPAPEFDDAQQPTASWADLVAGAGQLTADDIPQPVMTHAIHVLADTIGVMIAGARQPEIDAYIRPRDQLFSTAAGPSQLLKSGAGRTDPVTAAFVNATAGTFLEMDEGYRPTGHPAIHVVPAALSVAEALHSSGKDLMVAIIAGYEVTARLFEAYRLTYPLHPHGHLGALGAATAVAHLRGVDPMPAVAVAATLPLFPVWDSCFEGATARNAYTGTAAALGVTAHRLADAGFVGSHEAVDTAFGHMAGELVDPAALSDPVRGETLRVTRNYLKFHSACALNHTTLDALLTLGPMSADDVTSVRVDTVPHNLRLARQARPNSLSTRFSLPYAVAAALVHGHTKPSAFEYDQRVAALAERVEVGVTPEMESRWPDAAPSRVTVQTAQGSSTAYAENPRGHHTNPAGPDDLRNKFLLLVDDEGAGDFYARLLDILAVGDSATLFEGVF